MRDLVMIVFDIGANNGLSGWDELYRLTSTAPSLTNKDKVYAFEPTPYLIDRFLRVLERAAPDNFIVIPKAVSLKNEITDFHIARGRGCSSLHDFHKNVSYKKDIGPKPAWLSGKFQVVETIKVETIRLDTFIIYNNIDKIDFLHCDAQGGDLNVLKSLGDKIDIVSRGCVEAHHINTPLYNIDNSITSIVSFLEDRGFKINRRDKVLKTDEKEINIRFSR